MIRKIILIIIILAVIGTVTGIVSCDKVKKISDSVLSAAKTELEKQIRETMAENKVDIVETKTVFGKLNDAGEYQFFCALLIQTNSEEAAAKCANTASGLFGEASYMAQTDSSVEHEYLTHKTVTYDHTDFSGGNYYTVYVYAEDMTQIIDLSKLKPEE